MTEETIDAARARYRAARDAALAEMGATPANGYKIDLELANPDSLQRALDAEQRLMVALLPRLGDPLL